MLGRVSVVEPDSPEALGDAERAELERPFRSAGGVSLPTIALAAGVLAGFTVSTWAAVRGSLPLAAAVPLQALWGYLAFTPAHEAIHGNVAGSSARFRPVEAALGWVMSAVLALPFSMLEYLHPQHHSHTNDPEHDPDHRVAGSGIFTVALHCWTVQLGYLRVMQRRLADGSPGARNALRGMRWYGLASLALFAVSVRYGFWQWLIVLWIAPMWLAQGFLALVFDWLPHHPHDGRERYRDTRILPSSALEVLLLAQNYHLIHHLYPRVPFYEYTRCFRRVQPVLKARGARIS